MKISNKIKSIQSEKSISNRVIFALLPKSLLVLLFILTVLLISQGFSISVNCAVQAESGSEAEETVVSDLELRTSENELVVDENTMALWHMNEESWPDDCTTICVLDASDSNNHGKVCPNDSDNTPTTTLVNTKLGGFAASFDGSDDYVLIDHNPSLSFGTGDFTIEAWVKTEQTTANALGIISKRKAGLTGYGIWLISKDKAGCNVSVRGGGLTAVGATPINDGHWHYVACVRQNNKHYIYVDGVLDGSSSFSGNTNTTESLRIGKMTPSEGEYFKGIIDEVRISNIARTSEEILANSYKRPFGLTFNVSDLSAEALSTSTIKLTWSNPTLADFDHVVIKRQTDRIPQDLNDGITVYSGPEQSLTDTDLAPGTNYFYTVFVYDNLGNIASGGAISQQTLVEENLPLDDSYKLITSLSEAEYDETVLQKDLVEYEKNIEFIIDGNEIEVKSVTDLHAFISPDIEVRIPVKVIIGEKEGIDTTEVLLTIGERVYVLRREIIDGYEYFSTLFIGPELTGEFDINVISTFSDDSNKKINIFLTIDPYGYVYTIEDEEEVRIENAEVSLFKEVNGEEKLWDTNTSQYQNPQFTNAKGEYSFFVEPGRYKIQIIAPEYKKRETEWFDINSGTVVKNIELKRPINFLFYALIGFGVVCIIGGMLVVFVMIRKRRSKSTP